jgi:hypothetical protein
LSYDGADVCVLFLLNFVQIVIASMYVGFVLISLMRD